MPPDVKVSALPPDSSLDGNHYVVLNDPTGPTTKRTLLSTIATFLFNQVNLPANATGSPVTRDVDNYSDCVISGGVWTPDSAGVNRNASMSALVVHINGRRISITAVTARTFTASKDTYIDVLDNGDGTGTLVYTEVANGATTGFTLAANSLRLGYIVTAAGSIAATTSIFQFGQDAMGYVHFPKSLRLKQLHQCHLASGTTAISGSATAQGSGAGTAYVFNEAGEELFDPMNMHSTSVNPSRITAQIPGMYEVSFNIFWTDNATGQRILDVFRNATAAASNRNAQDGAGRSAQAVTTAIYMRKDDYVEGNVYQNSGGNLTPSFVNFGLKLIA